MWCAVGRVDLDPYIHQRQERAARRAMCVRRLGGDLAASCLDQIEAMW
ncbi:MAG: hypothetical protein AVDCRST_MAG18-1002 [uncultured Thermomicrobiales bacterium]|uniref:Uncharacterized protein n=1 Tax=uncultured Thermomicrobiales bacterium TaxID=1645740 RepID=A0A6J4UW48_9BACT|nr:MAG: hypothetical protein AVDCRST_MAG18-1002 [uncultured Thermomicrobiales bacterium]